MPGYILVSSIRASIQTEIQYFLPLSHSEALNAIDDWTDDVNQWLSTGNVSFIWHFRISFYLVYTDIDCGLVYKNQILVLSNIRYVENKFIFGKVTFNFDTLVMSMGVRVQCRFKA